MLHYFKLNPPSILEKLHVLLPDVLFEVFQSLSLLFDKQLTFLRIFPEYLIKEILAVLELYHSLFEDFEVLGDGVVRHQLEVVLHLLQLVHSLR